MAKKGSIVSDSFEQLVELGQSATKKTAKHVGKTVSPSKVLEEMLGLENADPKQAEILRKLEKKSGMNHTPLDLEELHKKQDSDKEASLRNRLFQLSRQEEQRIVAEKKQKKQQKAQQELAEEQEKKRREAEEKKKQQEAPAPAGKQRRSIFSPKKKAQEQHTKTRPATGKQ